MKLFLSTLVSLSLTIMSCGQNLDSSSSSQLSAAQKESVALVCKTGDYVGAMAFQTGFDMNFRGGNAEFVWGEMAPAQPWPVFQALYARGTAKVERLDLETAFQTQFTFLDTPKTTSQSDVKTDKIVATMTMQAPYNKGSAIVYANIRGKAEQLNFPSCKFVRVLHQ